MTPQQRLTLHIGTRKALPVSSLAEASRLYSAERDASGEGSSTFPGGVLVADGRHVASVSYNAKVWPVARWHPGAEPLFNPYR